MWTEEETEILKNNYGNIPARELFPYKKRSQIIKKAIGSFILKDEAKIAYDKAALQYFGKHAKLNNPLVI